ncbi:pseudaminic acid cytidylyltransferase [Psychroflexus sp. MES1-P1E]|uniref:pseudaminic acid cytidylyltransferase n=1 Tax=Psychroflexus sp. MES1-P1E TaxID=2058320 RepID=UPI000C7B23F6|nr:pseudaminic acid cytidylyltransferase [Psychroflexus sp. MES1-P1E]PKG43447.1 pseudaminic acid cytidylyltransferase [Psychroflexus sp. MES1-P1E]
MSNLCVIPARGGSKRIPRKNIKDFLGKPIIAYSIEAALSSGLFDEVMVSTDDEEIAAIAKEYGASIPFFRNKENANDFATLADVIDEVKIYYQEKGVDFDTVCCFLPTAPFVSANLLNKGFKLLKEQNVDSVKPIVRFSYPIQRSVKINDVGLLDMFYPEHQKTRSQDLEPAYHDAGQFYWMTYETGLRGNKKYGFEISEQLVQDIDTDEDWKIAELKYRFNFDK